MAMAGLRMRPEIEELRAFYASRQGQLARRLIVTQLRALWPDLAGHTVLGVGYAPPFLAVFDEARATLAAMPTVQGCHRWPEDGPCRTLLAREEELPLVDGSVDRVLLVHALESTPQVSRMLREVWRVLADGGRLLAIVPNRTGSWCWSERTPFGHGQPYSSGQLARLLESHLFTPRATAGALWMPPVRSRLVERLTIPGERLGRRFVPTLGGVVIVEAEKRIHVGHPVMVERRRARRRYAPVPQGALASSEEFVRGRIERRSAAPPGEPAARGRG
jgi:SAM-dependent methyltransferase